MRAVLVATVCTAAVLVLAACPPPGRRDFEVTQTDRDRLQVMLDEPVVRNAADRLGAEPGNRGGTSLGWRRGDVEVSLGDSSGDPAWPAAEPTTVHGWVAEAVRSLRRSGWTIMSGACYPAGIDYSRLATGPAVSLPISARPENDKWVWLVTAYVHRDGVSYWAGVTGSLEQDGDGGAEATLRAPNAAEPADLFPDRPLGMAEGTTCVERSELPRAIVDEGTPIELDWRNVTESTPSPGATIR